ncbi:MAG TPA: MFS transporter [Candidatus Methylomirabilis sp.]|nr:MFS transporter [Candidatus Methylomirabilis sp.]
MTPLVLLFNLAFLVSVDVRILAPVLPSISASLGSTPGAVGLAMTSYAFAYGTGQLFYGPLSDRLSRIAVVRAAGLGFTVCTVLSALSLTTRQFVLARLLAGAFAGAVIPLTLVFIGDTFEYERRQVVLARLSVVTSSALAFSASIGGTIAHFVSWRVMLLGYGLLALVPVGLMWRLAAARPAAPPDGAAAGGRFTDFLRNRGAQLVYLAVFFEGFLLWGGVTYLGSFATKRHGLDQFAVGMLIAVYGLGTMAGGFLMAPIRRRLSENGLARLGGALMGGAFLALIPPWPWPAFMVSMLALGLGFVCLHTTLQVRGTEISQTARGKAFSLFAFNLFSGIAAGTAVLGRLVDAGRYEALFALSGVGLILIGLGTGLGALWREP